MIPMALSICLSILSTEAFLHGEHGQWQRKIVTIFKQDSDKLLDPRLDQTLLELADLKNTA